MKYYLLGISWAIVIGVLSITPDPTRNIEVDHSDKIAHFGAYAILVATLLWGAKKHQQLTRKRINTIVIVSIIYGVIIEIIQWYLPYRFFEVLDILANTIGCLLGAVSIILFSRDKI